MPNSLDPVITLERFRQLVDAYGGDQSHWPTPERAGAAALLSSSDEAQRLLADAQTLDAILVVSSPPAQAHPGLTTKILADAERIIAKPSVEATSRVRHNRGNIIPMPQRRARLSAGLLMVAAAAAGLWVGVESPSPDPTQTSSVTDPSVVEANQTDDEYASIELAAASLAPPMEWE